MHEGMSKFLHRLKHELRTDPNHQFNLIDIARRFSRELYLAKLELDSIITTELVPNWELDFA